MTIDLTDGANAGWMSFTAEEAGTTDDGRRRIRIDRGRSRHAHIAVELDDAGRPVGTEQLDREGLSAPQVEEALDWYWREVLDTDRPEGES